MTDTLRRRFQSPILTAVIAAVAAIGITALWGFIEEEEEG